jgi:hypothetical protein
MAEMGGSDKYLPHDRHYRCLQSPGLDLLATRTAMDGIHHFCSDQRRTSHHLGYFVSKVPPVRRHVLTTR